MAFLWSGRYGGPKLNKLSIKKNDYQDDVHDDDDLACAAGGTWVRVLYCFVGGAARRVGIQVNLDFPSRLRNSLRVAAPRQESRPDTRIPPATQANDDHDGADDDDDDDNDGDDDGEPDVDNMMAIMLMTRS